MQVKRRRIVAVLLVLVLVCAIAVGLKEYKEYRYKQAYHVSPASLKMIQTAIAAQRGRVVVVNFWATWCPTCVDEFPALVRLQNRYQSRGLVVIALSADSPKDIRKLVRPFLVKNKAHFQVFVQTSDQGLMVHTFDPNWQGDIPRTFVYDKRGRLAKVLPDEQTDATFAAAVKPLL